MRSRLAWPVALAGLVGVCALAEAEDRNPPVPEVRRAFVTSSPHTGNLSGLAGADAICQQRATEASLPNPSYFVAFLSDSTTDAYCHVQGLTGTRATNCGLPTLPAEAGPWVRVDGFPFAARIDEALAPIGRTIAPLNLDEHGVAVDWWERVWTSTSAQGQSHPSYPVPCGDWTSTAGNAGAGDTWATTGSWLGSGSATCSSALRLVCLERWLALPLPPHRSGGALAFVTSSAHTGNLGGLAGADAICRGLATAAGLPAPDTFFAWLSTDAVDAVDRPTYDGPWIRPDGVRIASGKSDLTDSALRAPINVTENGSYIANYGVWTGTHHGGTATASDCGDWTSGNPGEIGFHGGANRANLVWTYWTTSPCDFAYRLYCLSDFPAVVFVDDFESSDTLAWSVTMPVP